MRGKVKEDKMSMKPQYETYRYIGETCRLHSQSVVECRLPGSEISSILAVYAKAIPADNECRDGEVHYGGKVLLSVVYEDGDKKICRAERGAEFFHKADGGAVTPACFAKISLSAENINWRREGSGLYISVVVDADICVYGNKQIEYLAGGEEMIVKKEVVGVYKTVCVSGETEGEDEFASDQVGDILLHSENAIVTRVSVGAGELEIEGEIVLNICVLKSDDAVSSYERITPFKMQIPSEEAFGHISASARISVKSAHLSVTVDEEKGKSKILFSYALLADCHLHIRDEIYAVSDAFSTEKEIFLKKAKGDSRYLIGTAKCVERVEGIVAINPQPEGEVSLQSAVLPRAEIVCRKTETGMEAEGAVLAEVLFLGADGSRRSANLTLPFLFPIDVSGEVAEADCVVCGLNLRRKKNGETEAEATLKISLRGYEQKTWEYIFETVEGETLEKSDGAFSVFMPRAGEDLWQVAKRLGCSPEEVQKHNPELKFPLAEGARIFVYRQIK